MHISRRSLTSRFVAPFALVAFLGCGPEVVVDNAGSATYVLDNQSATSFVVHVTPAPGSGLEEASVDCEAGSACTLGYDAMIGVNPLPTDSLASVSVTVEDQDGTAEAYRQEPIVNERWTIQGKPAEWTRCCDQNHATLTLTDADLTLP